MRLVLLSLALVALAAPGQSVDGYEYETTTAAGHDAFVDVDTGLVLRSDPAGYVADGVIGDWTDFVNVEAYREGETGSLAPGTPCNYTVCVSFEAAILGPVEVTFTMSLVDACGEFTFTDTFVPAAQEPRTFLVVDVVGHLRIATCAPGNGEAELAVHGGRMFGRVSTGVAFAY